MLVSVHFDTHTFDIKGDGSSKEETTILILRHIAFVNEENSPPRAECDQPFEVFPICLYPSRYPARLWSLLPFVFDTVGAPPVASSCLYLTYGLQALEVPGNM